MIVCFSSAARSHISLFFYCYHIAFVIFRTFFLLLPIYVLLIVLFQRVKLKSIIIIEYLLQIQTLGMLAGLVMNPSCGQ
ncbi:hypothetical protein EDC01DRAFT_644427 [Geopyxis carbonaria]|nr:hypothetical protein EDC01DRAFT_644427 [Geopyxis carbonaria]